MSTKKKRTSEYQLTKDTVDVVDQEDSDDGDDRRGGGRDGGTTGFSSGDFARASDAQLQQRRIIRVRRPTTTTTTNSTANTNTTTTATNPFARVNLLSTGAAAATTSTGSSSSRSSNPFAQVNLLSSTTATARQPPSAPPVPPPKSSFVSFSFSGGSTTSTNNNNINPFASAATFSSATSTSSSSSSPPWITLDRKLQSMTKRTNTNNVIGFQEMALSYLINMETIAASLIKKEGKQPQAAATQSQQAPQSNTVLVTSTTKTITTTSKSTRTATAEEEERDDDNDNNYNNDEEDDADASAPVTLAAGFSATAGAGAASNDDGYQVVLESDPVQVYQHGGDEGFKQLVKGKLVLQTSKDNPSDSRMVMKAQGGIKVYVNMKIQGNYTYKEHVSKKNQKIAVGQISFLGCNDASKGFEPFILKAKADVAKPLHAKLQQLSSSSSSS